MVHEVVTVSCGDAVWRQYCAEHGALAEGKNPDPSNDGSFRCSCFFEETNGGLFVPRSGSVDLKANVIDDIRNGSSSNLFHAELLLNGKEDAANNFARGHYTVGK